jgi:hypothetical protein
LAGLLVFTGIGASLVSRISEARRAAALVPIVVAVLVLLLLMAVGAPWIFSLSLGLVMPLRVAIVVAMLAPLGILLGMPFPIGLRIVSREAPAFVPWAWGVNGFFTVIGSVGGSILGMAGGFVVVLAASGACYVLALIALRASQRRSPQWHGRAFAAYRWIGGAEVAAASNSEPVTRRRRAAR